MKKEDIELMSDDEIQGLINRDTLWLNQHNTAADVYRAELKELYEVKHGRMKK